MGMKFSTFDFLPDHEKNKEIFIHLSQIIDMIMEENETELRPMLSKFRDYFDIDNELADMIIKEFGYGYIKELLEATGENSRDFRPFINLIHFLKGSRLGMELIFRLFNIEATVTEWWEESPEAERTTYFLTMTGGNINQEVVDALYNFSRKYVYPILREIFVSYQADGVLDIYSGIVGEAIVYCETVNQSSGSLELYLGSMAETNSFCSIDGYSESDFPYWY